MRLKNSQVSVLAAVIIFLVTSSILLLFTYNFITQAKSEGELEACKLSMMIADQTKRLAVPGKAGGKSFVALECPRRKLGDVVITKNNIVVNDKIDQNKAHKIIADAMAKCWYMAGEGKIDPFSNWKEDWEGKSICLDCKKISFDDSLIEWMAEKQSALIDKTFKGQIDISKVRTDEASLIQLQKQVESLKAQMSKEELEGFHKSYLDFSITSPMKYLVTAEVPKKGITYYEYFYGEKPVLSSKQEKDILNSIVFPDSVIYLRMYRPEANSWAWVIGKYAVAVVVAVILILGGAEVVAALGGILKIASFLGIVATGMLIATTVLGLSAATVIVPGYLAFKHCPDCDAIGGVSLIQPEIVPLDGYTKVCFEDSCVEDDDFTDVKICDLLVN